jgi:hypothetical protein
VIENIFDELHEDFEEKKFKKFSQHILFTGQFF